LFTQFRPDYFFYFLQSKGQNFFPTLGGQIIYFIYKARNARNLTSFKTRMIHVRHGLTSTSIVVYVVFTLVMKLHDRQSSERCIRKLISSHCLEKTRTRWNDFLFLITDDHDFRPQTCTNGLVLRECKHIKNIFEDVYFTKNSFHITLIVTITFVMLL
jgi:hypothetical protein